MESPRAETPLSQLTSGPDLTRLAEACLRFSPLIAIRANEALLIEIGGSHHLYTEDGFRQRARALCRRFGLSPQITVGASGSEALVLARFGTADLTKLPLSALADFADPFSNQTDQSFQRQLRGWIKVLRRLGVASIADFLRLPPRSLSSRLGTEAALLSSRIARREDPVWPRFQPPERIQERESLLDSESLESQAYSLEAALFGIKRACDRLMARLRARGRRAAGIQIQMKLARGADRFWTIQMPFAQGSTSGLLPILRDRLDFDLNREPLQAPIEAIDILVTETAPGHGAQKDLFRAREEEAEALDVLLGKLSSKLGPRGAFHAREVDRHLPEGAWIPCLDSGAQPDPPPRHGSLDPPPPSSSQDHSRASQLPQDQLPRPSRLLREPEPLLYRSGELRSALRRASWRILEWGDSERLSGEWWNASDLNHGFDREYFRVLAEGGEALWIFRSGNRLYLHGYFD